MSVYTKQDRMDAALILSISASDPMENNLHLIAMHLDLQRTRALDLAYEAAKEVSRLLDEATPASEFWRLDAEAESFIRSGEI